MIDELKGCASTFALGSRYLDRLVGDFTEADWAVRDAAGHDPRWLVGHLATYRNRVLAVMGLPAPAAPWEAHFVRGTSPAALPAELDMAPIIAAFHAASAAMAEAWEAQTAEAMAKPFGRTMPDGSETTGGAIRFFAWHEAYHLGQLGFMRRLTGKGGGA